MASQQYSNHRKFYYPHHFIFYPIIFGCTFISIKRAFIEDERKWLWLALAAVFILLGWLSFMMRQHYSITSQNRIIRLEMRLRYFQLTGQRFEEIESRLTFGQQAALRFASDAELPSLIQETLSNNLSPDSIKRSIKNWLPDLMRV